MVKCWTFFFCDHKLLAKNYRLIVNANGPCHEIMVLSVLHKLILHKCQMGRHEILALSVLCKLILQTRMRSHPVGLDVWFCVGPFVYFHTSCVRTAKALARLRRCAGSPEPSLVTYVLSNIISCGGSNGWWVGENCMRDRQHSIIIHCGNKKKEISNNQIGSD